MERTEGMISVIVAIYDEDKYLPRCIESITAQTYTNLEILLVDDGSPDRCGEICDNYAAGDSRITVIHKPNGGLSDARNKGMEQAHGEYIGFVDGDDYIEPFMYEKMITACRDNDAQIAICRYNQIGGNPDWSEPDGTIVKMDRQKALETYICGHPQYIIYNSVWSKLFRADVIGDIVFEKHRAEDIMFTTMTFCRADRFVYLDVPCYNYVCNRSSSMMNEKASRIYLDEIIPYYREQIAYLKDHGQADIARSAAYYFYRRMLFYYTDFRKAGQKSFASEIASQMLAEREQIYILYHQGGVRTGDRVRMDIFLFWPQFYWVLNSIYSKLIVPVRAGVHERKVTDARD